MIIIKALIKQGKANKNFGDLISFYCRLANLINNNCPIKHY